ncbi:hypothetical protein VTH8203_03757 [Vibrio thalassae]|uniref:Uncharacterized protein n=1 Tax=Vibrio thalassae TaxID=1243014 RepID=A0A240EPS4_9VIBR|nr:hypothetical protein VTH8203_03757 [Vibrio thalassae]
MKALPLMKTPHHLRLLRHTSRLMMSTLATRLKALLLQAYLVKVSLSPTAHR